jgi:broad specificity phosphatase PhoE
MVRKIFFIRHGIRLDFEDSSWNRNARRPHDPPLSGNGIIQAEETGNLLNEGSGIGHIFSSPFLRALQTADIIAAKLGLLVKVEHGFSEFLNSSWFKTSPKIMEKEEMILEFDHIDTEYRTITNPVFPETAENGDVFMRTKYVLEAIIRNYRGTIAVVAHEANLREAANLLLGDPDMMNYGLCAVNCLQKIDNRWYLDPASTFHFSVT